MSVRRLAGAISPSAKNMIYEYLCIGIIYSFFFWTLLNSICCILLFAAWLLLAGKSFDLSSHRTRLTLLFFSLYLVLLAGIFYTSNMTEGLSRLQEKVPILIFPLIFGTTSFLTARLVKKIATHFMIGAAISACSSLCYGLWQYAHSGQIGDITARHLLVFPDSYPYLLGLSSLLAIIMILSGAASLPSRYKWLRQGIIGILSIHIILLGTRVIIACWTITILIAIFMGIRGLVQRLLIFFALTGLAILIIATIPPLHQQWKEFTDPPEKSTIPLDQDASLGKSWGGKSIREAIWKCGSDIVRDHWLIGVGTGDIQDSLQQAYENRRFYFASRYNRYNAHNEYLQMLIGHGITGLCILVLCLAVPLQKLVASFKVNDSIRTCYFVFLCLFCVICFTEVILDINKGVIWYSFFNSVFAFAPSLNNLSKTKT
jgi:O-antigen ligase